MDLNSIGIGHFTYLTDFQINSLVHNTVTDT